MQGTSIFAIDPPTERRATGLRGLPRKEYMRSYRRLRGTIKMLNEWRTANRPYRLWSHRTRMAHRRKGCTICISLKELEDLARGARVCPYCGINLNWDRSKNGRPGLDSPSLDRIDNSTEIRLDNIKIVCFRCNATKGTGTLDELYNYARMLVERSNDNK